MTLLQVQGLSTHYLVRGKVLKAVDNVTFSLKKGEMLGLIGESGCGKSTLAMSLLRLIQEPGQIVGGELLLNGRDLLRLRSDEMRKVRWNQISLIPQSAMNALNPVTQIGAQIIEVFSTHQPHLARETVLARTKELLEWVGIEGHKLKNYPHEFSGGMKQRVAIAMSLACNPDVVVADEATTGLDVLTKAQVLALLKRLQEELGLSVIVISHDLPAVASISDRVAVMYAGRLVEVLPSSKIYTSAMHPYTRGLLGSMISFEGDSCCTSIPGNVPRLVDPPTGCLFHPRCGQVQEECSTKSPDLSPYSEDHEVACFLYRRATL